MPISTPARLLASVASLALVAASGAPALAQNPQVGTAAAVNPRATGQGGARVLELGSSIIHRERIQTSDTGSVQVMFVDKTTLNIGPGSNLVIDQFVYDPNKKAGSMALSLTKGAVRFVGGAASHTGGAEVKTPVATIGIRGGVAGITHLGGETRAILQFGTLTVQASGEPVVVRRPGFMVVIGPNGIVGPVRVTQAEIDALIAKTLSQGRQTGGRPGTTPDLAGLAPNAGGPCSMPAQGQTTMDLAAVSCRYFNTQLQNQVDTVAEQASQQGQTNVLVPVYVPPPPYGPGGYGPGGYGPGGYGPGGYGGGGNPNPGPIFPGFPNLPNWPNLPNFPNFPGFPGAGGGGNLAGGPPTTPPITPPPPVTPPPPPPTCIPPYC